MQGGHVIEEVQVRHGNALADYEAGAMLAQKVRELASEASTIVPRLSGTVHMINSTARGGGVAELLPREVSLLRQLGLNVRWRVIRPAGERSEAFFALTKRLHNLIHDHGSERLELHDAALYDAVSRDLAEELLSHVAPGDVVVVHDPQPLAVGRFLAERVDVRLIWRCHIGLDQRTERTRAAWRFMREHTKPYRLCIFSAPEYVPSYLSQRSTVMTPAIDPLSHKNRQLSPHKTTGILCNAGLVTPTHPLVTEPFARGVQRLAPSGAFVPAQELAEVGFLFRPLLVQISRWDSLKGFPQLLSGFRELKAWSTFEGREPERALRRRELARLVLAGPEPSAIRDDPEAEGVLAQLVSAHRALPERLQEDVAVLTLPMSSAKENALMVNVMQATAVAAIQLSLAEGFGLTATEAMWKRVPVIGTNACGLRRQIRPELDGLLVDDPNDARSVARTLALLLSDAHLAERMGRTAQRHVWDEFLVFSVVAQWLRSFAALSR